MKYSEERREAILRKLLPPANRSVAEVATEEGISAPTLHAWCKQARAKGRLLPDHGRDPEGWTSRDKFSAVVEAAAMSEIELAEYCRQRGLYPEQIQRWRRSCEQANARLTRSSASSRRLSSSCLDSPPLNVVTDTLKVIRPGPGTDPSRAWYRVLGDQRPSRLAHQADKPV